MDSTFARCRNGARVVNSAVKREAPVEPTGVLKSQRTNPSTPRFLYETEATAVRRPHGFHLSSTRAADRAGTAPTHDARNGWRCAVARAFRPRALSDCA